MKICLNENITIAEVYYQKTTKSELLIMMKKAQRHNLRLEKHWSVKRKWIEYKMKQFDFINKKMS